ncbi:MAG: MDR family MFS transporter [Candidatus Igneacidithiobacillus chanchocoensis]
MTTAYRLSIAQKSMFFAVLSAIFLAAMDQTVVATALPTIARDLHGLAHLPWVITAYLLSSTVSLPIYGKVGDLIGRKVVLSFAVAFFLVGSIFSGLAWNLDSLVLFRALQGLGGGGILVTAIASISDFLPLQQRGKYQGLVGAAFGLATLIGPFLGGFVVQHFGWRWIFYLNIPFGIFCLGVIQWAFPKREKKDLALDWIGAASLFFGLTALVFLVELGRQDAWLWPLLLVFLVSLWGIFIGSPRHPEPILPLGFFRHKTFSASVIVSFFVGTAMLGSISFLPTYYQAVRGYTPTQSGLEMLYLLVGMLLTSTISGRWISKHQKFRIFPIFGTLLTAIALWLLSHITLHTPFWQIDIALIFLGIGLGSTMQVMVLSAQWALPHRHLGVATSTVSLFRSMGGTLGVAAFGAVFTHFVGQDLGKAEPQQIVHALHWDFGAAAALTLLAFFFAWNLEELDTLMAQRQARGEGTES